MRPVFLKFLKLAVMAGGVGIVLFFSVAYWVINHGYRWLPQWALEAGRDGEILKSKSAKTCKACHAPIFEAWAKGRHAMAWTSESFVKDSENRSKEKCLPCHIPETVEAGTKPFPRLDQRDEGIFCLACHVKDGVMRGPYDLFSPPHPTHLDKSYVKSVFCSSCHVKTFKEWKASGSAQSCQLCHMPRHPGRLVEKFPLHLLHAEREVADHSVPAGLAREKDLSLETKWKGNRIDVVLENSGIPHALPTADSGDPRLYVYLEAVDSAGTVLDNLKEILAPQQETALQYKQPRRLMFFIPRGTEQAVVSIKIKSAWKKEKTELFRRILIRPESGAQDGQ